MASERQVLTFRTRVWLSFAPPTCRMPLGQASGFSPADPGGRVIPRFRHRLIRFRHFINGSLALASLKLARRNHVPTFPQCCRVGPGSFTPSRSQIRTCTLKPSPTGRLRRVLLYLSYSMALLHLLDTTPPSLLTTAARGGLRPAPDCRPRGALLHLSYSSAPSYADGAFVTHDPKRSFDLAFLLDTSHVKGTKRRRRAKWVLHLLAVLYH